LRPFEAPVTQVMYRSNRLEAPEELGYQIAFPAPSFSFNPYNSTLSTTDGCRHVPPRQGQFTCASNCSLHEHTTSQECNPSVNLLQSTGLDSDFPVSSNSLTSGLVRLSQDFNGGFGISRDSQCMLQWGNQSIPSSPFGHGFEGNEIIPSFAAPDKFTSIFNMPGCSAPNQTMPNEPSGFHDINSSGILIDDLQMPMSESFVFGQLGWYPSDSIIETTKPQQGSGVTHPTTMDKNKLMPASAYSTPSRLYINLIYPSQSTCSLATKI
jgi:hypothetical protein